MNGSSGAESRNKRDAHRAFLTGVLFSLCLFAGWIWRRHFPDWLAVIHTVLTIGLAIQSSRLFIRAHRCRRCGAWVDPEQPSCQKCGTDI